MTSALAPWTPVVYALGRQVMHVEKDLLLRSHAVLDTKNLHFVVHQGATLTLRAPAILIAREQVWIEYCTAVLYTTGRTLGTAVPGKDVGRHVKQGETCAVKGLGSKCSTLKPGTLVSVTACQGKAAVCQRLKVLSPDIFGTW